MLHSLHAGCGASGSQSAGNYRSQYPALPRKSGHTLPERQRFRAANGFMGACVAAADVHPAGVP